MIGCEKTDADYLEQAQALLPTGPAWSRDGSAKLTGLFGAIAVEFNRIDKRDCDLLREMIPVTTNEMLADWERVVGLPDDCTGPADSVAARRNAVVSKLRSTGGASPGYFIDLAASVGYSITITEFRPHRAGWVNPGTYTDAEWAYTWRVNAGTTTYRYFRAGLARAGERLRTWGNDQLECILTKHKPAHTRLIFAYS